MLAIVDTTVAMFMLVINIKHMCWSQVEHSFLVVYSAFIVYGGRIRVIIWEMVQVN